MPPDPLEARIFNAHGSAPLLKPSFFSGQSWNLCHSHLSLNKQSVCCHLPESSLRRFHEHFTNRTDSQSGKLLFIFLFGLKSMTSDQITPLERWV